MNIKNLQSTLENGGGYLIISPENRRYLTDFSSSAGYLIITKTEAVFLADSRYIEAAQNTAKDCESVLLSDFSAQLGGYIEKFNIEKLYLEGESLSVSRAESIKKICRCECDFAKADKEIHALRRIKTEDEKNKILRAQSVAEKAFENILGFIREGVTEREIALELDFFMLRNGAQAVSFETIAVSGKNSSMPHGVPSDKKVEKGDFITMDFGAVVDGYHSDMTRTVAVGSVSSKQAEVYETVLRAQNNCLEMLKAGVSCKHADASARDVIKNAGYGEFFGHGTGHGVGIEIHEAPTLNPRSGEILKTGDIVTVEPGIYLPSEFGVRIEDMAFITENGIENLTKSPKNLIIL
ncbi:MAG: aminopeptidase P family protein [Acutalibacteraceae bacterium]|nr:aminopeptidase P family protein [Acutalibacteraceae bacterium]